MTIINLTLPKNCVVQDDKKPDPIMSDGMKAQLELRKLLLHFKWTDDRKMLLSAEPLRRIDMRDAFKAAGLDINEHPA